jgi:uncharacterized protein YprB with RNaseH-like and TPR domain
VEDIRAQLERLGVRLGAIGPERHAEKSLEAIEDLVGGQVMQTEFGPCVVVDQVFASGYRHGQVHVAAALVHGAETIAGIARDPGLTALELSRSAFLDVETTGLAGGAGTYAFLVGIGWFEGEDFRMRQVFMRDYSEEPALMALVEQTVSSLSGVVSFNGRAFDVPVLESRFIMSRRRFPLSSAPHLDLLFTARRLWRLRLESCSLSHLESQVLGLHREGDVPSYLVPEIYFDYLRYGQVEPLRGVFYHNAQDVLSLAALTELSCRAFEDPQGQVEHPEDLYSLGRLYLQTGASDRAEEALLAALEAQLPDGLREAALCDLSFHYKRQERWEEAIGLWQQAIEEDHARLYPFVELAKYYEHRAKEFERAEELVLRAIELVGSSSMIGEPWWCQQRLGELQHRLSRVRRKRSRSL